MENVLYVTHDNATSNDVVRYSRTLVMCAPADATEIPNLSGTASRADACAGPSKSVVAPPPAGGRGSAPGAGSGGPGLARAADPHPGRVDVRPARPAAPRPPAAPGPLC